mmetsp:Transcript_66788/g.145683  ORF Transcript_66788/g.145683 Transcript_66788/m.145683 type:complete len:98 (+) Transcript_66788:695-988(+)
MAVHKALSYLLERNVEHADIDTSACRSKLIQKTGQRRRFMGKAAVLAAASSEANMVPAGELLIWEHQEIMRYRWTDHESKRALEEVAANGGKASRKP